jgi:hypothetical protein
MMPLTYADLLPVNARGQRQPTTGQQRVPILRDLLWLSPEPAPLWSTAGRRTRPAETPPTAAQRDEWRDRWRLFNAILDQEIWLAALTRGGDDEPGLRLIMAHNHHRPGDAPAGRTLPSAV